MKPIGIVIKLMLTYCKWDLLADLAGGIEGIVIAILLITQK